MIARPNEQGRRRAPGAEALLSLAMLAACSPAPDNPAAITADEDAQLNRAAAQLDAAANALPPAGSERHTPFQIL